MEPDPMPTRRPSAPASISRLAWAEVTMLPQMTCGQPARALGLRLGLEIALGFRVKIRVSRVRVRLGFWGARAG